MDLSEEHTSSPSDDTPPSRSPEFRLVSGTTVPGLKIPSKLSRETIASNFLAAATPLLQEVNALIACLNGPLKEAIMATTSLESFAIRDRFSRSHQPSQDVTQCPEWLEDTQQLYGLCQQYCNLIISSPPSLSESISILDLFTLHCSIVPKPIEGKKHYNEGVSITVQDYTQLSDLQHLLNLNAYYLPGTNCPPPGDRNCYEGITNQFLRLAKIDDPRFSFIETIAQIEATIAKDVFSVIQHSLRIVQHHWTNLKKIWPSQIFSKTLDQNADSFNDLLETTHDWVDKDDYYRNLRSTCRMNVFSSLQSNNDEYDIDLLDLLVFPIQNYSEEYGKALPESDGTLTAQHILDQIKVAIHEITACALNLHNLLRAYHDAATHVEKNQDAPATQRTPRSPGRPRSARGTPRSQPNSGRKPSESRQMELIQSPRRHSERGPNSDHYRGRFPSPKTRVHRAFSKEKESSPILRRTKTPELTREKTDGRAALYSSAPLLPQAQETIEAQSRQYANRYLVFLPPQKNERNSGPSDQKLPEQRSPKLHGLNPHGLSSEKNE